MDKQCNRSFVSILPEEALRHYQSYLEDEVRQRTFALVLARATADAANRARSVFLSNISHELRMPLNAILDFSAMMRGDEQLTQAYRENLDIINRSGEHLLALINDALETEKIEAGHVQLELTPIDLGCMVRTIINMMQSRAGEKGLELAVEQSPDFPRYIQGDEAWLHQTLINLASIAVKFTRQIGHFFRD